MWTVTKTFGQDLGLSCCYRQWRDERHCRYLHGYALTFHAMFAGPTLDHRNWLVSFGSFGKVKEYLKDRYDHKLLVAADDPMRPLLEALNNKVAQVMIVDVIGAEAFAHDLMNFIDMELENMGAAKGCELVEVTCEERPGNRASFTPLELRMRQTR